MTGTPRIRPIAKPARRTGRGGSLVTMAMLRRLPLKNRLPYARDRRPGAASAHRGSQGRAALGRDRGRGRLGAGRRLARRPGPAGARAGASVGSVRSRWPRDGGSTTGPTDSRSRRAGPERARPGASLAADRLDRLVWLDRLDWFGWRAPPAARARAARRRPAATGAAVGGPRRGAGRVARDRRLAGAVQSLDRPAGVGRRGGAGPQRSGRSGRFVAAGLAGPGDQYPSEPVRAGRRGY